MGSVVSSIFGGGSGGSSYTPQQTVVIASTANTADHIHGTVSSYNPSTGELNIIITNNTDVTNDVYASWTINLDGAVGVQGATGYTGATGVQGYTGATGVQGEIGRAHV